MGDHAVVDNIVENGALNLMKKEPEYFEGREAQLVYIAKKLRDATRLEEVLTVAGLDYGVETDEYHGGVIFRRTRVGAFFYVLPETVDAVHRVMEANGFVPATETTSVPERAE